MASAGREITVRVALGVTLLPGLVGPAFEGGLWETVGVAACPLRFAFLALDFGGVDEAVALNPFGRARVGLVVADVLRAYECERTTPDWLRDRTWM